MIIFLLLVEILNIGNQSVEHLSICSKDKDIHLLFHFRHCLLGSLILHFNLTQFCVVKEGLQNPRGVGRLHRIGLIHYKKQQQFFWDVGSI